MKYTIFTHVSPQRFVRTYLLGSVQGDTASSVQSISESLQNPAWASVLCQWSTSVAPRFQLQFLLLFTHLGILIEMLNFCVGMP